MVLSAEYKEKAELVAKCDLKAQQRTKDTAEKCWHFCWYLKNVLSE